MFIDLSFKLHNLNISLVNSFKRSFDFNNLFHKIQYQRITIKYRIKTQDSGNYIFTFYCSQYLVIFPFKSFIYNLLSP